MAFMKKQSCKGTYYVVETNEGTWFVPSNVCGWLAGLEYMNDETYSNRAMTDGTWLGWCRQLSHCVGRSEIQSIEKREGTLYRLSAPGYLDCTDWTPDADSPEFDDDGDEDCDM
jgi:hypothetical protein